jgi:hypothetical protein
MAANAAIHVLLYCSEQEEDVDARLRGHDGRESRC